MNARRSVILGVGAALALGLRAAGAEHAEKIRRIGVLWIGTANSAVALAFKDELRRLGYEPGRNIDLEERALADDFGRFSETVADLLRLKVDLLVMSSTRSAAAAAKLTSTVPIVVASAGDLVGAGLAESLSKPGRNVTGLSTLSPELGPKRLELLKDLVPGLKRVAVAWNPEGPAPAHAFKEIDAAARALGLQVQSLEVRRRADFESRFSVAGLAGAGGLLVVADPLVSANVKTIVRLVSGLRVVAVFPAREFAVAGGLASYGPNRVEMYRRSAHYVDQILRGRKPADLPIELPVTYDLVINSKTAKAFKLQVPPQILVKADTVIE